MARYHIDTIPVWDALQQASACPLCLLRARTEALLTERFLGGSVMEPDTRVQVNRLGFCADHHRMLYAQQNRLGHALMTHTHMKEARARYESALRGALAGGGKRTLFGKKQGSALAEAASALEAESAQCILCGQLDENLRRYAFTFAHLHANDSAFRQAFAVSDGLCMPHTALLLRMAEEALNTRQQEALVQDLLALSETRIRQDEEDLEWFTLKFDYRNREKPWNNSRDALERCANRLRGRCLGKGGEASS